MRTIIATVVLAVTLLASRAAHAGDESRSISRTHRTIGSVAFMLERSTRKVRNKGMEELRPAIVHNTAARIALKKDQGKAAMHLTLEARRIAREIMERAGEGNNTGFSPDPEETQAAAGGAGKAADAALAEAERKVPTGEEYEKTFPYDVDQLEM